MGRMAPATRSAAKTRTAPVVSVTLVALVNWETVGGDLAVWDTTLCVTNRGSKVPTTVSIVTTWTPTKKLDHVLGVVMTTLRVGPISMCLPQEQIVPLRIL